MKTKIKIRSFTLTSIFLVLFLILVSSVASASITETRITTSGKASHPTIYGNRVVWEDWRNGDYYDSNIYMYDLANKKETNISTNGIYPSIYMNRLVWVGLTNKLADLSGLYVKDLSTNKQKVIFESTDVIGSPKIYGDNLVYSHALTGSMFTDIYVYNLSTSKYKTLSTSGTADGLDIDGNKIVWYDFKSYEHYEDGNWDINLYDLSTSKEKKINTNGKESCSPAIYNNKIVWQDKRNGNWDVYMYDLSTNKETQITTSKSDQIDPDIYGNTIVWQDNRSGNWNIYTYDLITHQQIHTTDKSDQVAPALYDNKVVWTDYRNGDDKPDIYLGTISFLPVAAFTASPTSGNHPLNVQFNDKSIDAYYWTWDFGDKTTSTLQSPAHKYTKAGKYSVTLTVKNAAGKNTMKKTNYIIVK